MPPEHGGDLCLKWPELPASHGPPTASAVPKLAAMSAPTSMIEARTFRIGWFPLPVRHSSGRDLTGPYQTPPHVATAGADEVVRRCTTSAGGGVRAR